MNFSRTIKKTKAKLAHLPSPFRKGGSRGIFRTLSFSKRRNFFGKSLVQTRAFCKGVTLIEVIVAMFVFTTIIIATTVVFSSSSQNKKFIGSSQKKYDAAFAALGEVGKYLSTSTTNLNLIQSSARTLIVYNYSEKTCAQFSFPNPLTESTEKNLVVRKKAMSSNEYYKTCDSTYLSGAPSETVIENVTGQFYVRTLGSDLNSAFVTISAKVYDGLVSNPQSKWIPIQTTLSLRDYLVEE